MPLITVRRTIPEIELKADRGWTDVSLAGLVPSDITHIYLEVILRSEKPDDVIFEVCSPSTRKADDRDDPEMHSRRVIAKNGRVAATYVWMRYDPQAGRIQYRTQGIESPTTVGLAVVGEFYWPEQMRGQVGFRETSLNAPEEALDLGDWTPFGA
jgi:hypothetical protein